MLQSCQAPALFAPLGGLNLNLDLGSFRSKISHPGLFGGDVVIQRLRHLVVPQRRLEELWPGGGLHRARFVAEVSSPRRRPVIRQEKVPRLPPAIGRQMSIFGPVKPVDRLGSQKYCRRLPESSHSLQNKAGKPCMEGRQLRTLT